MTDRAALLMDLAERCEKAEGADEILNADIEAALHPELAEAPWERITYPDGKRAFFADRSDPGGGNVVSPPLYTASRDDARSLLPEEWHMTIGDRKDWPWAEAHEFPQPCRIVPVTGAKTVPLAMCAVALRARALASGAPR